MEILSAAPEAAGRDFPLSSLNYENSQTYEIRLLYKNWHRENQESGNCLTGSYSSNSDERVIIMNFSV